MCACLLCLTYEPDSFLTGQYGPLRYHPSPSASDTVHTQPEILLNINSSDMFYKITFQDGLLLALCVVDYNGQFDQHESAQNISAFTRSLIFPQLV